MKIMKRLLVAAAVLAVAFTAVACSKPREPETSESPVAEASGEPMQTTTAGQTETPVSENGFQILTGVVTKVTDTFSDVTLKSGNTELSFNIENADVETSYEIEPETELTIVYKGEIKEADTSGVSVVLVVNAQADAKLMTATGSVVDQAMSSFTIKTEAGEEMGFLKNNCEGLGEGVLGQASDDSNGSGVIVTVTYLPASYDSNSITNLPVKVESAQ